jgi:hypothetical protein
MYKRSIEHVAVPAEKKTLLGYFMWPRFCLTVMATEPSANADDKAAPCIQLVLFGTDAEQVVGSAIDSLLPGHESDWLILPEKIQDVIRKTIEARVSVASRSFDDGIIRFQVNRLLAVVAADNEILTQGKNLGMNMTKKMLPSYYTNRPPPL